jgi:hypothetical protein
MEFAVCLRMRQSNIKSITTRGKEVQFETFKDSCSTFVYIPALMERAGTIEFIIKHPHR